MTRSRASRLINATPEQNAFVKNTAEGLCFAANGIDWHSGDNVALNDLEFPSNVFPWFNLTRYGVEIRMVESADGRLTVDSIAERIDAGTCAVSIIHVGFGNGFRNDLAAIGALCREKDICFVVDAIQSLGQTPVDVEEMSIYLLAADGHKWPLSPEGTDIFYCAPWRPRLLADRLVDGLRDAGYRVLSPRGATEWSGIVKFDSPEHETEDLQRCEAIRSSARRGGGIRISPHFYNTAAEVLRVADALPEH